MLCLIYFCVFLSFGMNSAEHKVKKFDGETKHVGVMKIVGDFFQGMLVIPQS